MTDRLDRQQERMIENGRRRDVLYCRACDSEITEQLHCERCGADGCRHQDCLRENEVGELLCLNCYEAENTPVIQAAKRAAFTGSHKDLHNYIKLRKAAS